ncbi:MAG TPA: hypothetical protein VGJ51_13665, partial [Candidatus Angelobacter sp.]
MRRRDFNLWLLKAGAASILTSQLRAHAFGDETARVRELYTRAIVIDSLCAPFAEMDAPPTPDALDAVRQSGITAVNFTSPALDFEETVYALATLQKLVEDHAEAFLLVRRHSDLARCKRE